MKISWLIDRWCAQEEGLCQCQPQCDGAHIKCRM